MDYNKWGLGIIKNINHQLATTTTTTTKVTIQDTQEGIEREIKSKLITKFHSKNPFEVEAVRHIHNIIDNLQ